MNFRYVVLFAAGLAFGLGLAFSGMTDASRVIGFLDVTGAWDPSLLFVMAGAVATFGAGLLLWRRVRGGTGWFGITLPGKDNDPVDRRLVIGSAIFGIGWGLSGFCPGPALANLGGWRTEALVFLPAMAAGMWIARKGFKVDCD
jgi:uncharacterized membrane protein YedE/YeeE